MLSANVRNDTTSIFSVSSMGYSRWIIAIEQRLPKKSIMVILGYYIIRSDLRHNYIRI